MRLPKRGQPDSVWLNGLALSKGAYQVKYNEGKLTSRFSPLPPSVLFVERAALVEHMIAEVERLQPERYIIFSLPIPSGGPPHILWKVWKTPLVSVLFDDST